MGEMEEKEQFSLLIHNFLNSIRLKEIPENKVQELMNFVYNLNKGTEIQKRRFIMFFNVSANKEMETFSTIARKEQCTYSAIKNSVIRITSILVNLKNEEKKDLMKIIKNDKIL